MKEVRFGRRPILYTVERVSRKTLGITVRPDASVAVRAPLDVADEAIARIVQ